MSDLIPLGIHFGLEDSVYRADPGVAQSSLKLAKYSMNHCRCSVDGEAENEDSEARAFGRAFHAMMLQPHLYDSLFVVAPDGYDGRTKAGKDWKAEHTKGGQEVIIPRNGKRLAGMKERLLANRVFREAYESCDLEVSMFHEANTPFGPVRVKGRPDIIPKEGRCIVDLKKTTLGKAHPDTWSNEAAKLGYHIQAPYYIDIFNAITSSSRDLFIHFAVEDVPPYEVGIIKFEQDDMEPGRVFYQNALLKYAECVNSGIWPGYPDHPVKISLPQWAKTL